MNIFINTIYLDDISSRSGNLEKRFPLIYFWLKDYYYQQSSENFNKVSWSFNDETTPIEENTELQNQLLANPPDIVGLSLYLWNEDVLLANACWIKKHFPDCLIVAAGPNADTRQPWMEKHTYIDITVPGPAAETFRRIVDMRLEGKSVHEVAGVNYFDGEKVVRNTPVPRKEDPLILNYVNNFREEVVELLNEYTSKYSNVIVLTMYMQGCPYSCSFCEQGTSLWTKVLTRDIQHLYDEIDLLAQYPNIMYEFADANFGIVPAYETIVDYIIENGNGNIIMKKPPFAKNNVEHTFHLMDKMINAGIYYSDHYGNITLQDPNPEIVKMNGRPFSKEYEKIKAFQEYTKDEQHKMGQVEIILGLPGQSFDTLTNSLHELVKYDLLSHYLPYFYLVFPNTVITSPGSTANITSNKVFVRRERSWAKGFIDPLTDTAQMSYNQIIATDTITSAELISSHYHWTLMCHLYGFLGWIRTPLNYIETYHNVSNHEFIKEYTSRFHPDNWQDLPESIRLDLEASLKWLTGKDKLLQRKDNTGQYFLAPRRISQYRFHANYNDFEKLLISIFEKLIGTNDEHFYELMKWQGAKVLPFDVKSHSNKILTYNYDDIAASTSESYWKSKWTFEHNTQDLTEKMINLKDIDYIPVVNLQEVDPRDQVELMLTKPNTFN